MNTLPAEYKQIATLHGKRDLEIGELASMLFEIVGRFIPHESIEPHLQEIIYGDWLEHVRDGDFHMAVYRLLMGYFAPKWRGTFWKDEAQAIDREARSICMTFYNNYQMAIRYVEQLEFERPITIDGCMSDGKRSFTIREEFPIPDDDKEKLLREVIDFDPDADAEQIVDEARKNYRNAIDRWHRDHDGLWRRVYMQWYVRDMAETEIHKLEAEIERDKSRKRDGKFRKEAVRRLDSVGIKTKRIASTIGISESLVRRYKRELGK